MPLENPREVIAGAHARFGAPMLLELGGLGVRSLSAWRGEYLIIAGDIASGQPSRLFRWRGGASLPHSVDVDLRGLNPEGFVTPESAEEILLLSDDGTVALDGTACKRLSDRKAKRFRALRVKLPAEG